MDSNFYRTFEDRFRGSRDIIKERLKVYIPFVLPVSTIHNPAYAIDLGCGRGEWLELLGENGFLVSGVDIDDGMLAACKERGLNVSTDDAITFLKDLPDDSQSVISAFHLVEHISFESVLDLVKGGLRALKPGGLLILETPNPENIVVGSCNFYVDPTHKRPIPPQLLAFVPEYFGFSRVKVLRLQEPKNLIEADRLSLLDVLSGVSPDYAVVAQKGGDRELLSTVDSAFRAEFGVTLGALANRWQQQIEERISVAQAQTALANKRASEAEVLAEQAKTQALAAEACTMRRLGERDEALAQVAQLRGELQGLYASKSWRVTGLLRRVVYLLKSSFRPLVLIVMRWILRHARIKAVFRRLLHPFPWVIGRLRALALHRGLVEPAHPSFSAPDPRSTPMSPRAGEIYARLLRIRASNTFRGHD